MSKKTKSSSAVYGIRFSHPLAIILAFIVAYLLHILGGDAFAAVPDLHQHGERAFGLSWSGKCLTVMCRVPPWAWRPPRCG